MERLKPGMSMLIAYNVSILNRYNTNCKRIAEIHSESLTLAMYLHTLVSFTSTNTWAILRAKNLAGLKLGMSQLCNNILGTLVQKGFFLHLKVSTVHALRIHQKGVEYE